MPIGKSTATESAASGTGPSFAQPSPLGPSFASGDLVLPGPREAWTFCVSPTVLSCWRGRIVPCLAKAWHTPGLGGNGRVRGRGEGFVANLRSVGFEPVPHDIECAAFGRSRTGSPHSAYLDRHEGRTARGEPVTHWSDAWHRPRALGSLTTWDFDADGWLDFLGRCLALVSPGELEDVQRDIATRQLLAALRGLQDRPDPRALRGLRERIVHLPADCVPDDLRDLHAEATAAGAPKRGPGRPRKPAVEETPAT